MLNFKQKNGNKSYKYYIKQNRFDKIISYPKIITIKTKKYIKIVNIS